MNFNIVKVACICKYMQIILTIAHILLHMCRCTFVMGDQCEGGEGVRIVKGVRIEAVFSSSSQL